MKLIYRGPVQGVYLLDGDDEVRYTVVGNDDPDPLIYQGDTVEVPDATAKRLLEQDIWELADKPAAPRTPALPAKAATAATTTTPGA